MPVPTVDHAADEVHPVLRGGDVVDGAGVEDVCLALQRPVLAGELVPLRPGGRLHVK